MFRINRRRHLLGLLLGALLVHAPFVQALKSDRKQPINIKADQVEVNEKTEISHYKGRVFFQQGTLKINADEVKVHLKNGRLDKVIIDGNPATFEQQRDEDKTLIKSRARHMEYFADTETLHLQHDARVEQGANIFSGDFIKYDTLNSRVDAKKGEGSDTRVNAVIIPADAKQEDKPTQPQTAPTDTNNGQTKAKQTETR